MKIVKFGIIGCGLMGREFASAAARWCHLEDMDVKPEITAVCDTNEKIHEWFKKHFPSVKMYTKDYKDILNNKDVEAVYCALPHNLHEQIYCDIIKAGKHMMGEKPFGIDLKASLNIEKCAKEHPNVFIKCSSEYPFIPAMQKLCSMIEAGVFGKIIEVNSGFLHSSDMDPTKPINWKRMVEYNGEYGVVGDLGMHPCHVTFKAGWYPKNVRAILSKLIKERPDGKGKMAPCLTWDNGTLFCECVEKDGNIFPWTAKMQRLAPGEKDTWYFEILGTKTSVRYSSKNTNSIQILEYNPDKEQAWQHIDMGQETAFKVISGKIFEFSFSDSILQMWAAFLYELANGKPLKKFAGCVTLEETVRSHKLFTAALESHKTKKTIELNF